MNSSLKKSLKRFLHWGPLVAIGKELIWIIKFCIYSYIQVRLRLCSNKHHPIIKCICICYLLDEFTFSKIIFHFFLQCCLYFQVSIKNELKKKNHSNKIFTFKHFFFLTNAWYVKSIIDNLFLMQKRPNNNEKYLFQVLPVAWCFTRHFHFIWYEKFDSWCLCIVVSWLELTPN